MTGSERTPRFLEDKVSNEELADLVSVAAALDSIGQGLPSLTGRFEGRYAHATVGALVAELARARGMDPAVLAARATGGNQQPPGIAL